MRLSTGAVLDRYEVLGVLGEGGMAVVYTVRHKMLGSEHVLKVLTAQGTSLAQRLIEEGRVQAQLKHPNIVEVTDVIEVQGAPGLVMELVRGPSLDRLLVGEPLPLPLVEALVPRILAGMAAAHTAGFIHRDLKPANILVAKHRGQVVPKIADFGLVKRLDAHEARTRTGTTMGTPQYMSPEQIKDARHLDARCDIFALGAILYELLAGQRAYQGESVFEVFQNVTARSYAPIETVREDVPERMSAAIRAAMGELDQRPPDCAALWRIWSGGAIGLEEAAAKPAEWPASLLDQIDEMAPKSVVTTGPASGGGADTSTWAGADAPTVNPAVQASGGMSRSLLVAAPLVVAVPVLLVAVAAALAAGLGLAWIGTSRLDEPVVAVVEAPPPPAPAAPAAPEPVPEPEPPVAPVDVVPPVPVVPVAPPPPAKAKVAPAPVAPARVDVSVTGKGDVALESADGQFRPGEVPPGTYTIRFSGTKAGTVTVAAGEVVRYECMEQLRSCRKR